MQLSIINFRDVSGYRNVYGEVMKPGKIFRGGPLDQLSTEEITYMEDVLGIRYILDYRDAAEAAMKPDAAFLRAEYLRIGAMKGDPERERQMEERNHQLEAQKDTLDESASGTVGNSAGGKKIGMDFATLLRDPKMRAVLMANQGHLTKSYRYMLFDNPAYHAMFERLLRGDGALYFHCSAGKDRTGLSAMLIMMALGMSEEDIVKEYLLSNVYLKDFNAHLCQISGISPEEAVQLAPMLGVVEENIRVALSAVYEKYDCADEFLEAEYGIAQGARERLRRMYCE